MKPMRSALEWSLIAVGVMVIALSASPTINGDAAVRYMTVQHWLGGDGGYSKFSLLQPALSMPLAWLAVALGIAPPQLVAYFNIIVFVGLAAAAYPELARRYSAAVGRTWLLLMMGASMFPHHLQHYYGEVLSSMCLLLGILWIDRRPWIAVPLLALACASTPALIIPFAATSLVWLVARSNLAPCLALVLAVAVVVCETWIKNGGLSTSYLSDSEHGFPTILPYSGKPGFSYPMVFGVLSILLSFGKGLVFYIPALLLALSSRTRTALGLDSRSRWIALVVFVAPVLFYSKWWAWYGGAFWGPRFFLFLCAPACLLMAIAIHENGATILRRLVFVLVVALSAWVALDGYVFGQNQMDACWAENYANEYLCWYLPEFSALWRPFVTGRFWQMFGDMRWPYALWNVVTLCYLTILIACDWLCSPRSE